MIHRNRKDVPIRDREGLRSHVMLEEGDGTNSCMAITWVDVEPKGRQHIHRHDPEQVYIIIQGTGRMTVGDETREVRAGDLIFIPPNVPHGVENVGSERLTYVSASTPTFSITRLYDSGELARR